MPHSLDFHKFIVSPHYSKQCVGVATPTCCYTYTSPTCRYRHTESCLLLSAVYVLLAMSISHCQYSRSVSNGVQWVGGCTDSMCWDQYWISTTRWAKRLVKVAGYLSPTHCEYHYKLRRGWGSRYYTIHGNGEDRVQNFRTKFLILCSRTVFTD